MDQVGGFVDKLGIPGLLTIAIGIAYKLGENKPWLTDRTKTLLALALGGAVGIFFLFYSGQVCSFKSISDHIFYGINTGATSIGLFKILQSVGIGFSPPGVGGSK